MLVADEFPAYDPHMHNPATCTVRPCRRCDGPHTPAVPAAPTNPHRARTLAPPKPQIHGLTMTAMAALLRQVADELDQHGEVTWRRFHDWQTPPKHSTGERGGGNGGTGSADDHRDRQTARRVAGYFAEYQGLLTSLVPSLRRVDRLHTLAQVEDRAVTRTRTGDLDPMLAAEAAAAGYCASCWRWEQTCHDREKDNEGHYYDTHHCRRCARFRNEHGILPPVELLRIWHGLGRRTWTTTEVATALDRGPQGKR